MTKEDGVTLGTVKVKVELEPSSILLLAIAITLPVLAHQLLKNF